MGFYPVCPGSNQYVIGTPYFDKMTLRLPTGKHLTITAEGNSASRRYIDAMTFNGTAYEKNYFTHSDLLQGGTIVCHMADRPNTTRATAADAAPYSFSTSGAIKN